ncbi:hypothetical protein [Silvanigrella aquatica]|uniref:Uncharacterized protein n=1 Tax=Silvanigrella aquatica TaxID=1915309 RepID=A0A1L4D1I6_9BACT|nr:hypothetical protein [Silvanigrella aquatica]APJ04056.1 hypothetical protein AXG55_09115 [Silvanigrella aquatica]
MFYCKVKFIQIAKNSLKPYFFVLFALFISAHAHAIKKSNWYEYHPFLSGGFKFNEYKICNEIIQKCPIESESPFKDKECVEKYLNKIKECEQTKRLLTLKDFSYDSLKVKSFGKFTLIDFVSLGDGMDSYYIISPAGYLVETAVNPLDFNKKLQSHHTLNSNLVLDFEEPVMQSNKNGKKVFTSILSMRNCVACETNLCAKVQFHFSSPGIPLSIQAQESNQSCIVHD